MNDLIIWFYQLMHGLQDDPLWDEVYITSGLLLIIITFLILLFYYHILNRYFINWFKLKHWIFFMFINSMIIAIVNNFIAIKILEPNEYSSDFLSFAFINFLYAAIFYSLFSILFSWGSPFAKFTPYKFYTKSKRG
ncbi:MAG: hypothetical protein ACUVQP_04340 [Bacteroidales bacterium]